MYYSYVTVVFPIITVMLLFCFFAYYFKALRPRTGTLEWIGMAEKKNFSFRHSIFPMEKKDIIPIIAITLLYGAVAYWGLGINSAPQSFFQFNEENPSVTIELQENTEISSIMYYTGLWHGHYTLEVSRDGVNWTEQKIETEDDEDEQYAMDQSHADLFKWMYASLNEYNGPVKYIRITSSKLPMELGELAIYDSMGNLISKVSVPEYASALFDEQALVPEYPTYLNSAYFDEIYHARTAYENVRNVYPYEVSHPPLGKLIISLGIRLFGMTPFGWRFMGTLFGILMLPLLYVFIKNMFGKTVIASCGTLLFAFDFMHYTQTRIATIDTYGVIFIILMAFFMYRYINQDYETGFLRTCLPLFLCGLSFGVGAACKWTSLYAGPALVAAYTVHLVMRGRYYISNQRGREYAAFLIKTLLASVLFFILIPAAIYCLSYIPYGLASGMKVSDGMLLDRDYYRIIIDNNKFMFSYHSKLQATHSYASPWWQWVLDIRPILYYRSTLPDGTKSAFAAFGNPVLWWGGLLAVLSMIFHIVKNRDGKALFIAMFYISVLLPWMFISRCAFIYHYFPCTIFLTLALCHVLNGIWDRKYGRYKFAVFGITAGALLLFIAFYPVISGSPASAGYTKYFLRWIPSQWPF